MGAIDEINKIIQGFGQTGGNIMESSPELMIMALIGYIMDQEQQKETINPKDALSLATNRYSSVNNMLMNQMSGQTQNPQIGQMRDQLQDRATNPPLQPMTSQQIQQNPIALNQPKRFDPYAQDPNYGQPNPELLNRLRQMVGAQTPNQGWGTDALRQNLSNRFGTRNLNGKLTPLR